MLNYENRFCINELFAVCKNVVWHAYTSARAHWWIVDDFHVVSWVKTFVVSMNYPNLWMEPYIPFFSSHLAISPQLVS